MVAQKLRVSGSLKQTLGVLRNNLCIFLTALAVILAGGIAELHFAYPRFSIGILYFLVTYLPAVFISAHFKYVPLRCIVLLIGVLAYIYCTYSFPGME